MKDFGPTGKTSKVLKNHYAVKYLTRSEKTNTVTEIFHVLSWLLPYFPCLSYYFRKV